MIRAMDDGPAVLVADDEPLLRRLMVRVLESDGLRVLAVENGDDAVRACADASASIAVIVLDVTMPGGGAEGLERVLQARPDLGIVVTSGAAPEAALRERLTAAGGHFLQKPFAPDALRRAVREALPGGRS
jgi:two-component system C4-dicarboxylate transport response regulator DctD